MLKVLIVEDEKAISNLILINLKAEGYSCTCAYDGKEAADQIEKNNYDLILLDIMLPEIDGYELLEYIRPTETPVIFITAKGNLHDRVQGLRLGADDYIVKPFSAREVVARIKAVLRRFNTDGGVQSQVIRRPGLEINIANYDVRINGESIPFTPKEVEILYLLASNPGRVFDREHILSKVWGYDFFGDTRAVDTQIKRIRQKLPDEELPWSIKTVYGVGYKFEVC